jgi:hypothetical protein
MNKLIIMGSGKRCMDLPDDYSEDVYDIFGLSTNLFSNKIGDINYKLIFEIHKFDSELMYIYKKMKDKNNSDKSYIVNNVIDGLINQKIYPYKEIMNKYGDYVCSSFVWILFYAIEEGYTDITFSGIDYGVTATTREILIECPNLEYWVGYFRAKGIKITTTKNMTILKSNFVYGFERIEESRKPIKEEKEALIKMLCETGNYSSLEKLNGYIDTIIYLDRLYSNY